LWAARRGLSESELLDLLGNSTSPSASPSPTVSASVSPSRTASLSPSLSADGWPRPSAWEGDPMFGSAAADRRDPLPQALWSPFYLAAEHALVNRGGLIGFAHQYFRDAVERRYLATESTQTTTHQDL